MNPNEQYVITVRERDNQGHERDTHRIAIRNDFTAAFNNLLDDHGEQELGTVTGIDRPVGNQPTNFYGLVAKAMESVKAP